MMKRITLAIFALLCALAAGAQTTVFNCSTFSTSGSCGAASGSGTAFTLVGGVGSVSSGKVILQPSGQTHLPTSVVYGTAVNVQAFDANVTFVPNGQNIAFVLQNNTNTDSGGTGRNFSSGAGCEGGFYQNFATNGINFIFAMEFDSYSPLTQAAGFTGSNVQIYQANQDPCVPFDGGQTNMWATTKLSTSPVSVGNSPTTTQNTSNGDTIQAWIGYDGATVTLCMADNTLGNSCTSSTGGSGTIYTHSFTGIAIPGWVGATTAFVSMTNSTGLSGSYDLDVNSFSYITKTPTGIFPFAAYNASSTYNTGTATPQSPVFSVAGGSYSGSQTVSMTSATSGAYLCVSTGTSQPALLPAGNNRGTICSAGTEMTNGSSVTVSSSETVYAVAVQNNTANMSPITSATYTITGGGAASQPTFSPSAGSYGPSQSVSLTSSSSGAIICYTTNGTTPATNGTTGCGTGSLYSTAITVSSSETIKAIAGGTGYSDSTVGSAVYTINGNASAPTFSPVAGSYGSTQTVTISSTTSGAAITYCIGVSCTPTLSYSGPISVSTSETVGAFATASGYSQSTTAYAAYTITAPAVAPVNSITNGNYQGGGNQVTN